MEINFSKVHEEKEMYAVLKASVINGKEIESQLLGIYESEDDVKKAKKKLSVDGHKTVVKVKVHIDPIEYLWDIDNIK